MRDCSSSVMPAHVVRVDADVFDIRQVVFPPVSLCVAALDTLACRVYTLLVPPCVKAGASACAWMGPWAVSLAGADARPSASGPGASSRRALHERLVVRWSTRGAALTKEWSGMASSDDRRVVYSDGAAIRYCKRCGAPAHTGRCASAGAAATAPAAGDGVVRIARDRKGRGGKTVTVITGLPGDDAALAALAQSLKKLCGSGGTTKAGVIEIQGDHRDRLAAYLKAEGYRVKLAGG